MDVFHRSIWIQFRLACTSVVKLTEIPVTTSEHYDVVVVGRTIAGLMAATLLAKRRLRVRVLDTKFSLDPNLPVFGLETTPLLHPLLDEMGLVHDVRTRIYGPPKPITIALPDRRFSMSPDVRERAITFGEVFPKSIDELMKLFSMIEQYGPRMDGLLDGSIDLSADGFRSKRSMERLADESGLSELIETEKPWSKDPVIRDFVRALLVVSGRLDGGSECVTPSALRTLWHLCFGIPSIRHGRKGLEELLAQKLLTTGGTIEDDRIAHRFDLRRKRVRTIETTDGAVFGADAIILSGGHYSLNKLTGDQTQSLPLAQLQTIAVPDQEIPSPFRDPCGWVETEGGHPVLARPGNGRIELMSAENHLPQLKTLLPMSRLARPNAEPLPWAGSDTVDLFGFCTAGIRSPLKNLLFVGEAVMPGLGIEGDCITAYQAADAVSSAKSSRWPFGSRL
jgi:hypothetical protein